MSRVGRAPIEIPKGVNITIDNNLVTVKGPKGELKQQVAEGFEIKQENGSIELQRPSELKKHKSMHGLYRSLINNMAVGVSEGFTKELELVGVGYRAEAKGQVLELSIGFSHQVHFVLPPEIKAEVEAVKGKNPKIKLSSHDKQLVGQIAAKIRAQRPVEPYKGKGVRYANELVRRKQGKAAGKK